MLEKLLIQKKIFLGEFETSARGLTSAIVQGGAENVFGAFENIASGYVGVIKKGIPQENSFGAFESEASGFVREVKFGRGAENNFGAFESSATGIVSVIKNLRPQENIFGAFENTASGIIPYITKDNLEPIIFEMSLEEPEQSEEVSQVEQRGTYIWESRRWVNSGTSVGGHVEDAWSLPVIVGDPDEIGPITPQLRIPIVRGTALSRLGVLKLG